MVRVTTFCVEGVAPCWRGVKVSESVTVDSARTILASPGFTRSSPTAEESASRTMRDFPMAEASSGAKAKAEDVVMRQCSGSAAAMVWVVVEESVPRPGSGVVAVVVQVRAVASLGGRTR